MGTKLKRRKKTRKQKIAEGYLTCKSEKTPRSLIEALNKISLEEIQNETVQTIRNAGTINKGR